jgi:hypothetical protein
MIVNSVPQCEMTRVQLQMDISEVLGLLCQSEEEVMEDKQVCAVSMAELRHVHFTSERRRALWSKSTNLGKGCLNVPRG